MLANLLDDIQRAMAESIEDGAALLLVPNPR